jgi:hypothetical protein
MLEEHANSAFLNNKRRRQAKGLLFKGVSGDAEF